MEALRNRISSHSFAVAPNLTNAEIRDLIETVTATPSSFNIQHWRFIAVTDPERKEKLQEAAFNQALVSQSAVTFIVLADLRGHDRLAEILERSVSAGKISADVARYWVELASVRYGDESERHDEAIRSGSMAAMSLMAAAADKGWASCPMIGFDAQQLKQTFSINDRYLPIMLVAVGREPGKEYARMERLKVDEVLSFNSPHLFA